MVCGCARFNYQGSTPQFNWNASQLPGHPMPVPPVFQPELARAIAYLAEHPRRNMWVGLPTAYTIPGERLAPKLVGLPHPYRGVINPHSRHAPVASSMLSRARI